MQSLSVGEMSDNLTEKLTQWEAHWVNGAPDQEESTPVFQVILNFIFS